MYFQGILYKSIKSNLPRSLHTPLACSAFSPHRYTTVSYTHQMCIRDRCVAAVANFCGTVQYTPLFASRNRWNPGGIQGELALEQAAGVPLLHHDGWILCSGFPVPQTSPGLPSHHRDLTPVCRFCPAQLLD